MSTTKKKISKRQLIKALKGDMEEPVYTKESILDHFKNPPTQEEWLRGYHRWVKKQKENGC
jgi:hypothetical protein